MDIREIMENLNMVIADYADMYGHWLMQTNPYDWTERYNKLINVAEESMAALEKYADQVEQH